MRDRRHRCSALDHVNLGDEGFNVVADGGRVYVTTGHGDLVVIDVATRGRIARLGVGEAANGLAAVSLVTNELGSVIVIR